MLLLISTGGRVSFLGKHSLKFKLLILVLASIVPMAMGGIFALSRVSKYSEELLMDNFEQNAKELNSAISAQFFERYGDVQAFAINQSVISMNEAVMTAYLDHYISLYGIYDIILVVDKNGRFVAANDKDFNGNRVNKNTLREKNFAEEKWFKAAIEKKYTEDASKGLKGTYVEDFIYDPIQELAFNSSRVGSSFTTVIRNKEGEAIGVITNRAGARWVGSEMIRLYNNLKAKGFKSSEVVIINKNGYVIGMHDPEKNGEQSDAMFSTDISLRLKVPEFEHLLNNRDSGSLLLKNSRKNIEQIAGYSFNDDPKFISSIGWYTLVRESKEVALKNQFKITQLTYYIFAFIGIFSLGIAYWFSSHFSHIITEITEKVASSSTKVAVTSGGLSKSSNELFSSAQSQADAINETSSSIEQISQIITANVDTAEEANNNAIDIQRFATETQSSVNELSDAMKNILASNKRIEQLVSIIEEIGAKTEIIDEIVFQTQLLSFNASVEAERAGEYGRGFAVVAQEVGSLAQLSGKAASEISLILKNSIKEAELVVIENNERVVKGGVLVSRTQEKMGQVLNSINKIYFGTEQISNASREQSIGMSQISTNVQTLSQNTTKTASVAEEAARSSSELASQSEQLMNLVSRLKKIISGHKKNQVG